VLELRKSFAYVENMTFTGRKMIAGVRDCSTYMYVDTKMKDNFKELIKLIKTGMVDSIDVLDGNHRLLAEQMDAKGFFKTSEEPIGSFNELNSYTRILYKKEFNVNPIGECKAYYAPAVLYLATLSMMGLFVLMNRSYLDRRMEFSIGTLATLVLGVLVTPILISFFHEIGHYTAAKLLGVPVAALYVGLFMIYPTIYIAYNGLNLNSTLRKVCTLLGGIAGHVAGLGIGVVLINCHIDNVLVDIWMLGNTSMILIP